MAPVVRRSGGTVLTRAPTGSLARFRQVPSASFVAPTFADSPTGTLIFGGLVPFEQVGSTTIPIMSGRRLPLARGIRDRAAMRRYVVAASAPRAVVFLDTATGTLIFGGSSSESASFSQTASGTLVFSGSSVESEILPPRVQIAAFIRVG